MKAFLEKSGYVKLLQNVIKDKNLGISGLFKKFRREREAWWEKKDKVLVGTDSLGNNYYSTTLETEFIFDASAIPSEWHMWLNHIRDEPPLEKELITTQEKDRRVIGEHIINYTGERDKRYSPTGHFLNLEHQNPENSHRIEPFDPNTLVNSLNK